MMVIFRMMNQNQNDGAFMMFIAWIFHELNSLLNLITHLMYLNTARSITINLEHTNTIDQILCVLHHYY